MNVLLLRQEEGPNDKYHTRFHDNTKINNVSSIPVLAFEFCSLDKVRCFIDNIENYSGLIFTSKRAISAFQNTITDEELCKIRNLDGFRTYVVGRTSEDCLKQLGLSSVGADTGNAQELAGLIINEQSTATKPLMFLCGNLARETIPLRLTERSIPNECISCYKTVPDEKFEEALSSYLKKHYPDVIVFFSPSGAEFYLNKMKTLLPCFEKIKILCIGDYTREAVEKLGQRVDGVAGKPSPDGLFAALENAITD